MDINEACRKILGGKTAVAIIADQGLHWAVVAAMAAATTDDDAEAIRTLREHVQNEKAMAEHAPRASDFL